MKYSSYKKDKGLTDTPHVMLDTVHAMSLLHRTRPAVSPETITYVISVMGMTKTPATDITVSLLFKEAMSGKGMTDVTVTALHHTPLTSTPGTVTVTTTITYAVLVRLNGEVEMQVHTPGPVFAPGLLKGMHTPTPTGREPFISCC